MSVMSLMLPEHMADAGALILSSFLRVYGFTSLPPIASQSHLEGARWMGCHQFDTWEDHFGCLGLPEVTTFGARSSTSHLEAKLRIRWISYQLPATYNLQLRSAGWAPQFMCCTSNRSTSQGPQNISKTWVQRPGDFESGDLRRFYSEPWKTSGPAERKEPLRFGLVKRVLHPSLNKGFFLTQTDYKCVRPSPEIWWNPLSVRLSKMPEPFPSKRESQDILTSELTAESPNRRCRFFLLRPCMFLGRKGAETWSM